MTDAHPRPQTRWPARTYLLIGGGLVAAMSMTTWISAARQDDRDTMVFLTNTVLKFAAAGGLVLAAVAMGLAVASLRPARYRWLVVATPVFIGLAVAAVLDATYVPPVPANVPSTGYEPSTVHPEASLVMITGFLATVAMWLTVLRLGSTRSPEPDEATETVEAD